MRLASFPNYLLNLEHDTFKVCLQRKKKPETGVVLKYPIPDSLLKIDNKILVFFWPEDTRNNIIECLGGSFFQTYFKYGELLKLDRITIIGDFWF